MRTTLTIEAPTEADVRKKLIEYLLNNDPVLLILQVLWLVENDATSTLAKVVSEKLKLSPDDELVIYANGNWMQRKARP
jgi:hypothetical protein